MLILCIRQSCNKSIMYKEGLLLELIFFFTVKVVLIIMLNMDSSKS